MPTWGWILIGIGIAVVLAAVGWVVLQAQRRRRLQSRFGSEYDRAVAESGGTRAAVAELSEREKHREELDIRPLDMEERARYRQEWQRVQSAFVDSPQGAVRDADALITQVLRDRGYPVDDFETQAADISVDHPEVVENYRAAHRIATASARGDAGTEDHRQAMVHYRSLFDELVEAGEPVGQEVS